MAEKEKMKRYDIICLPPQEHAVYFVIGCGEHGYGTYDLETRAYVFEEGTCPTNFFISGVEQIITDGVSDPHGLFEYVRTIDVEEGHAYGTDNEWWREVLPEAFGPPEK